MTVQRAANWGTPLRRFPNEQRLLPDQCGCISGCMRKQPLCGPHYTYLGGGARYYSWGLPGPGNAPSDFSLLRNSTSLQITILSAFSPNNTPGNMYSGNMPTSIVYYDPGLTTTAAATASEVPLWGSGAVPQGVRTSLFVMP